MLPFEDRYSRQRRLPEVGARGQIALEQARPVIRRHAGLSIEQEYLCRSGVGSSTVDEQAVPRLFAHAPSFQFAGPSQVAQGAWCALQVVREILQIEAASSGTFSPSAAKEVP